jgi:hypothetical protein
MTAWIARRRGAAGVARHQVRMLCRNTLIGRLPDPRAFRRRDLMRIDRIEAFSVLFACVLQRKVSLLQRKMSPS